MYETYPGAAPTANTATDWSSFLQGLLGIGLDYTRMKLLDVEGPGDDRNIPDQADLRYGVFSQPVAGGITVGAWILLGVVAVAGFFIVSRMK